MLMCIHRQAFLNDLMVLPDGTIFSIHNVIIGTLKRINQLWKMVEFKNLP